MKILVLSDIHGGAAWLKRALELFDSSKDGRNADLIVLCGDFLNHGPRNPLPDGWDTKETARILNENKKRIIAVRGNCDSEVDQMMLEFPCLSPFSNIFCNSKPAGAFNGRIFVHHGHLYDRKHLESILSEGTLVVSGHTHVTVTEKEGNLFYFNPGSISLPKCEDGKTCGIIEITENKAEISLCSLENTENDGNSTPKVIRSLLLA